jgi:hypothetical protein
VHNEPDIAFIDAHTKGNRGNNYMDLIAHPSELNILAGSITHPRMVEVTFDLVV